MKKIVLSALVALAVASFGGEFEDCLKDCKAKKGGSVLADFECPNEDCKHLKPGREDINGLKGDFTGNHATGSGGAVSVGGAVSAPNR